MDTQEWDSEQLHRGLDGARRTAREHSPTTAGVEGFEGLGLRLGLAGQILALCLRGQTADAGRAGQALAFRCSRLWIAVRGLEILAHAAATAGLPGDAELASWGSRGVLRHALSEADDLVTDEDWPRYERLRAAALGELRRDPGGGAALAAWVAAGDAVDAVATVPTAWSYSAHTVPGVMSGEDTGPEAWTSVLVSHEQQQALRHAQVLLTEHLIPLEAEFGECGSLPPAVDAQLSATARELGLWAPYTPRELGGAGLGVLGAVLVRERVAQSIASDVRQPRGVGGDPWPALYQADPAQRERYLVPHLAGEKLMFFGLTEPAAGSDVNAMQTRAVAVDGGWRIDGSKHFIGNASRADFGAVFAKAFGADGEPLGITCFLVDRGTPGFQVVREIETMGACRPAELAFEGCVVPADHVLGRIGAGLDVAKASLGVKRVLQGSMCLGPAQRALAVVADRVRTRQTFGKPLAERQAVQEMLAGALYGIRAARLLLYAVAHEVGTDRQEHSRLLPEMKVSCAQAACHAVDTAIQLAGAKGMSRDLPLERLYRDIRAFRITEGADEIQYHLVSRQFPAALAAVAGEVAL